MTPKKAGYAVIVGPGYTKEFDTCTCKHCNRVWTVRSTEKGQGDPGGWCNMCMAPICPECAGKPCFPLEERLLLMERRDRLFKEMGI